MNKPFKIYIDLDETLINAIPARPGGCNSRCRTKVTLPPYTIIKPNRVGVLKRKVVTEKYYTILRPGTETLLKNLRDIAAVRLLTTAAKDYAIAHNETFDLGFDVNDIVALEDWTFEYTPPYGSRTRFPSDCDVDYNSVLIDNMKPNSEWALHKRTYLGITQSR